MFRMEVNSYFERFESFRAILIEGFPTSTATIVSNHLFYGIVLCLKQAFENYTLIIFIDINSTAFISYNNE